MPHPCPPLDPALIRWLDETYPEASAKRGTSVEDLWFNGGRREVVRALKAELQRQERSKNNHVSRQET